MSKPSDPGTAARERMRGSAPPSAGELAGSGSGVVCRFTCDGIDDEYVVTHFEATEQLGRPYRIDLIVTVREDAHDPLDLVGRDGFIELERPALTRRFAGIVARVSVAPHDDGLQAVTMELVPALSALAYSQSSRIFQEKTAVEILTTMLEKRLAAHGRTFDGSSLTGEYLVRDYCVQYQETDFDFVHRLMEEEGIGYYFEVGEAEPERLVLFDTNRSLPRVPTLDGDGLVHFDRHKRNVVDGRETILELHPAASLRTTAVTVREHDWARTSPRVEQSAGGADERGRVYHSYEHGHGRSVSIHEHQQMLATIVAMAEKALLPDGMPLGLGRMAHELVGMPFGGFTLDDAAPQVRARHELAQRDRHTASGIGAVIGFSPGSTFELMGHPTVGADGEYLLTSVTHSTIGGEADADYSCSFTCIPLATAWRPTRATPHPRIYGVQTATVIGPIGLDIYTDQHGRIRVQFHWDRREPSLTGDLSCWIRVSQAWAGEGFPGIVFTPRVGMEVVVTFIDGDPDRPLVTGCVYNANHPPPTFLPAQATKSIIKTRSVPHIAGAGYNELSFEDAMGMERIHIHAERDLDELVKNDHTSVVMRDRRGNVRRDVDERIGRHQRTSITGDRKTTVGGAETTEIAGDHRRVVGGTDHVHIGGRHETVVEDGSYHVNVVNGEHVTESQLALVLLQAERNMIALLNGDEGGEGGEGGADEKGVRVQTPDSVKMSAGPVKLEMNAEDGVVRIVGRNGSISIEDDKIELKLGASTLTVTPTYIKANSKTFPA